MPLPHSVLLDNAPPEPAMARNLLERVLGVSFLGVLALNWHSQVSPLESQRFW